MRFSKLFLTFVLSILNLYAETKNSQLSSDFSVKKSEREAVLIIPKLGMSDYKYDLPVEFCPLGDNEESARCYFIGRWKGSFSKNALDSILSDEMKNLVSQKYDKITFQDKKVEISTATKNLEFKVRQNINFKFENGSDKEFKLFVNNYLDSVSHILQQSLSLSSDSRYNELSEKDDISFVRTQGKSKDMPSAVSQALLNSAFAFSVYYGKISGKIIISEQIIDIPAIGKQKVYSTFIDIDDSLDLIIYKFTNRSFQEYKILKSGGSSLNLALSLIGLDPKNTITVSKPDSKDGKEMIQNSIASIISNAIANFRVQIKKDRQFKIKTPILQVDGSSLILGIGSQQDIRTDHPFLIERVIDGKIETVGFLKIRKRGNNCLISPEKKRKNSIGSVIKGSYEVQDLAVEYPWSGKFTDFIIGTSQSGFKLNDENIGGGNNKFLSFSMKADLGYIFDSPTFSEVWLGFNLGVGLADDLNLTNTENIEIVSQLSSFANFSFAKRFYLGTIGVYTDLGFQAGVEDYFYDFSSNQIKTSLNIKNTVLNPFLTLGYNFSPDLEIFGKVGYTVPFSTEYTFSDEVINDPFENQDLNGLAGINLSFGISIHSNFIDLIFGSLFSSPPSNSCKSKI